jgi:hypothetical protein
MQRLNKRSDGGEGGLMKTFLVLTSAMLIAGTGVSQSRQNPNPMGPPALPNQTGPMRNGNPPFGQDPTNDDLSTARIQDQQSRSRNGERQKRLVADTDKLVNMVNELKEQVERPGEPPNPAEIERKADEIEKLAKSVKDKMKG